MSPRGRRHAQVPRNEGVRSNPGAIGKVVAALGRPASLEGVDGATALRELDQELVAKVSSVWGRRGEPSPDSRDAGCRSPHPAHIEVEISDRAVGKESTRAATSS